MAIVGIDGMSTERINMELRAGGRRAVFTLLAGAGVVGHPLGPIWTIATVYRNCGGGLDEPRTSLAA
jgi:hypothetical protein